MGNLCVLGKGRRRCESVWHLGIKTESVSPSLQSSLQRFELMKSAHRSVTPDSERLLLLRQQLGWTQQEVAAKSGYSVRLIRKIEKQQSVRPQTLRDIVECYSRAIHNVSPKIDNFILRPSQSEVENSSSEDTGVECELVTKMREYYDVVYQKRQPDRIVDYCCPNIRYTSCLLYTSPSPRD